MTQPTLINLHPNEYTQGLCYYPYAANLGRYVGSYNTLNDLSNRACIPNKTEDVIATSNLGIIQAGTLWTMLRHHHDVATGT